MHVVRVLLMDGHNTTVWDSTKLAVLYVPPSRACASCPSAHACTCGVCVSWTRPSSAAWRAPVPACPSLPYCHLPYSPCRNRRRLRFRVHFVCIVSFTVFLMSFPIHLFRTKTSVSSMYPSMYSSNLWPVLDFASRSARTWNKRSRVQRRTPPLPSKSSFERDLYENGTAYWHIL